MIEKINRDKCILINENDINLELILQNDKFKICSGNVTQYIVDEQMHLKGVISSIDIEREQEVEDINLLIKNNPIYIVSNRQEKSMVEKIFNESPHINSIPCIDKDNIFLYAYQKVNENLEVFVEKNEILSADFYCSIIWEDIRNIERQYGKEVKFLTDILQYGGYIYEDLAAQHMITENDLDQITGDEVILLAFLYDFNCYPSVKKCTELKLKFRTCNLTRKNVIAEVTPYFKMDQKARDVLTEESYKNSDYFDLYDFQNIFQALNLTHGLAGDYVEIGTYRGDSARAALSYMRKSGIHRKAWFIDTYEGFTYASAKLSSDCVWANTHTETSLEFVTERLSEFSSNLEFQLVKRNIITDELPTEIGWIAVCNIDVDMYEAVGSALMKVTDHIARGGIIIAEDYGHTPDLIGAQLAIVEFYEANKDKFLGLYMQSGQFFMIKK